MFWNAGSANSVPQLCETINAFQSALAAANERSKLSDDLIVGAIELHHFDNPPGLFVAGAGGLADFFGDSFRTDLGELIQTAKDAGRGHFQAERFEQTG